MGRAYAPRVRLSAKARASVALHNNYVHTNTSCPCLSIEKDVIVRNLTYNTVFCRRTGHSLSRLMTKSTSFGTARHSLRGSFIHMNLVLKKGGRQKTGRFSFGKSRTR